MEAALEPPQYVTKSGRTVFSPLLDIKTFIIELRTELYICRDRYRPINICSCDTGAHRYGISALSRFNIVNTCAAAGVL